MDINNLNKILSEIDKLSKVDKAILLKKISQKVKNNVQMQDATSLTQLSGLGAPIWRNVDIDKYLDDERKW